MNDRLKQLSPQSNVDYTPKRVPVFDPNAIRDPVISGYEAALAPPADVLAQTFGIVRWRRTAAGADFIEYVYEHTNVLGIPACKAYRITEHPLLPDVPDMRKNPPAGRQLAPATNETVTIVPCHADSYEHVAPGSLTTPVPRRIEPSPRPSPLASPP
ncbi:MAG: hypothetical protein ABR591_01305 [Candidatus Velthaea sp.]